MNNDKLMPLYESWKNLFDTEFEYKMTYDNALRDINKTRTVPDLYEINIGNTLASFLKELNKHIPTFLCDLAEISNVDQSVFNMFKKSISKKCSIKSTGIVLIFVVMIPIVLFTV